MAQKGVPWKPPLSDEPSHRAEGGGVIEPTPPPVIQADEVMERLLAQVENKLNEFDLNAEDRAIAISFLHLSLLKAKSSQDVINVWMTFEQFTAEEPAADGHKKKRH